MSKILERLDELIKEGERLYQLLLNDQGQMSVTEEHQLESDYAQWMSSVNTFLPYASLQGHLESFKGSFCGVVDPPRSLIKAVGVLRSAKQEIELGFVSNIKFLVHAEFFDSLIDQADELLKAGYFAAAAVTGRIVIEQWIRDIAEKAGIKSYGTRKTSQLNDDLKKRQAYSKPHWRHIQGHIDTGNHAAHGETGKYTNDDVKNLLVFARANCLSGGRP